MTAHAAGRRCRGALLIEFALVLLLFLTFLFAVVDFGRMLYTWNAAGEAARVGARYAVVCDNLGNSEDEVLARMQAVVPEITGIDLHWFSEAGTCGAASECVGVEVRVTGLRYEWMAPISTLASRLVLPMPAFTTVLVREAMRGDPNSDRICTAWPGSPA